MSVTLIEAVIELMTWTVAVTLTQCAGAIFHARLRRTDSCSKSKGENMAATSEATISTVVAGAAEAAMTMSEEGTETTKWIAEEEAGEGNGIAKNLIQTAGRDIHNALETGGSGKENNSGVSPRPDRNRLREALHHRARLAG